MVSGTSKTVTAAFNQTLFASVRGVNNAGIESTSASNSAAGTLVLDPAADRDGDGARNDAEDIAQTNPLDPASTFRIVSVTRPSATSVQLTWTSVPGAKYEILAAANVTVPFTTISGPTAIPAASATTIWLATSAGAAPKFYKIRVVP